MKYDLTTEEGRKAAVDLFDKYGWTINIYAWSIKKIIGILTQEDTEKQQRKTAVDIIKAGKENGIDELEIVVDNNVGLNFGCDVDGVPVKAQLGKNGKMTLKVKYK